MPDSVKKTVRDAALTTLAAMTGVKFLGVYASEIIDDERLPAVLVSTGLDIAEQGGAGSMEAIPVVITLAMRIVAKGPTEHDSTVLVQDTIDAIEQQIHERLKMETPSDDPLGVGAHRTFFDSAPEPEVDDDKENPVAIVTVTYGVMMRVSRADLSTPV